MEIPSKALPTYQERTQRLWGCSCRGDAGLPLQAAARYGAHPTGPETRRHSTQRAFTPTAWAGAARSCGCLSSGTATSPAPACLQPACSPRHPQDPPLWDPRLQPEPSRDYSCCWEMKSVYIQMRNVYVFVYIHTHTFIYTYRHFYIYIQTYTCAYLRAYIYINIYMYMYICI